MTFSKGSYVLGVDLGGSNIRAALYDGGEAATAEVSQPTASSSAQAIVRQLGELGRRLARDAGVPPASIEGAGVGLPGVVTDGRLRMAPNLPPFGDADLEAALADELGAEVVVDNDVNMATVGECWAGHGSGVDHFVFIAVGTGVGMGIVANGRVVQGFRGAAGEIGAMPVPTSPGLTLEEIAGGVGLVRRYAEVSGHASESTAVDVFADAERGKPAALQVIAAQVQAIALAAVAVQCVLDPQLIVLGGGIGSRPDFVARVRARVQEFDGSAVRLEPSALGAAAGMVGAAHAARLHLTREIDV
jgi:predicted NBD/HSP70 family sugar kinase